MAEWKPSCEPVAWLVEWVVEDQTWVHAFASEVAAVDQARKHRVPCQDLFTAAQFAAQFAAEVAAAVRAERERCALVCDRLDAEVDKYPAACAAAIRTDAGEQPTRAAAAIAGEG